MQKPAPQPVLLLSTPGKALLKVSEKRLVLGSNSTTAPLTRAAAVTHGKVKGRDAAELSMKWTPSSAKR